jgi:hypothetical protein
MRSEKDKMLAGELYDASAPDTQADLAATPRWLARYNAALDMPPPAAQDTGGTLRILTDQRLGPSPSPGEPEIGGGIVVARDRIASTPQLDNAGFIFGDGATCGERLARARRPR